MYQYRNTGINKWRDGGVNAAQESTNIDDGAYDTIRILNDISGKFLRPFDNISDNNEQ